MKKIYLTIDEFPSEDGLDKLNYLEEKDMPAILFCRGDALEKRLEYAVKAVKKGFILGNHTYSHPNTGKADI